MPFLASASLLQFSFFPNGRLVLLMFVTCASFAFLPFPEHTYHVQSPGGAATLLPAKKKLLASSILCGTWMSCATSTRFFHASFWYSFCIAILQIDTSFCRDTGLSSRLCCRGIMIVSCILLCSFSDAFLSASVPSIVKITSSSLFVCLWFSLLRFFFAPTSVSVDEVVHGCIRTAKSDVSRGLTLSFVFPSRQ